MECDWLIVYFEPRHRPQVLEGVVTRLEVEIGIANGYGRRESGPENGVIRGDRER